MKLKRFFRRALALGLTAAALAGPMAFPASRTGAETEFDTGGTAFSEPSYDTAIMYFWHEGIPKVSQDKGGNYIRYPVIISWNDKYYLCTDSSFKNELNETSNLQEKKNDNWCFIGIGPDWNYFQDENYGFEKFDRVWGDTNYYMRYLYDISSNALLSKVGIDLDDLFQLGEAVSMVVPDGMPFMVCTKPEADQYAIGLSQKAFGKDYWLVGRTKTWLEIRTGIFNEDAAMWGDVQWGLAYEYWNADQFLNKNYTYTKTRHLYDEDATKSYTYSEGPDQHYWTVKRDSNGQYHFWTTGESDVSGMERISGSISKESNRQRTRDWFHANDLFRGSLYYSGSTIGANGETIKYADWKDRQCTVNNTDGFKVYYADPNIVSFHRDSFDVADGQVVTLDGPRVIDMNCTVTVHNGGVLACNGWVINNGQILIEPGGMLILTERDTATGDHQFGAITSVDTLTDTANGRIACDGTIIINRDCKLTCAGTYGLQLGESAQVVNYGQIIAENMEVYSDYAIENRGDTSAVFAGWGLTTSGYAITRSQITDSSYRGKGTVQKAAAVSLPKNAIYGVGADRLYVNSARTVTYTTPSKRKGYVSGYQAPLESLPSDGNGEELPSNIAIYNDERYDVNYILNNSIPYHYDTLAGVWIYYPPQGEPVYYNYRMPSKVDTIVDGQLPDGYKLCSGLVVGQAVKDDLYYDNTQRLYWFADNGIIYYYEEAVADYIHVKDRSSYFCYKDKLDPPPTYAGLEHMPTKMLRQMEGNPIRYESGMQEVENTVGRPQVQVEGDRYYVEIDGKKYYWVAQYELFLQDGYTLNGDGKPIDGVPRSIVDPGYYDLDETPNAKPKVKKDDNGRYYVEYQGEVYYWYESVQAFLNGSPTNYAGKPLEKGDVDLSGYTLP